MNTLTVIHEAAQEAMRDTVAPIGSRWVNAKRPAEVWELVERNGSGVLLRMSQDGTRRHKSGLLHNLLGHYTRVRP